jgi:putative peptidoglycan lipid II flippase
VRNALAIGALATGLVISLREPLVALAFEYGSFGQSDTAVVASFLLLYALSIPFWVVHQVVTRAFYARRQMWTPVVIGTAATIVTVPALVLALNRLGGEGIALVSSASVAAYAVTIAIRWYGSEAATLATYLGRVSMAALAAGLATTAANYLLLDLVLAGPLRLMIGGIVGVAVYAGTARMMGIEEVTTFLRKVRLRLGG